MTGSMPVVAAAMLLTAALTFPARPGRLRGRALAATPTAARRGSASALRPLWLVVGCGAVGAIGWALAGAAPGVVTAVLAATAGAVARRRTAGRRAAHGDDTTEIAGCWQMLAACLEAGLPVSGAVLATAPWLTGAAGRDLRRVAGLLDLGADAVGAWRSVEHRPALAPFARAAARSAGTGAALARVARAEATRLRAALSDVAQVRAQRAAVLITGPLGLCFLPAFLVLGVAPVVVGLADQALARW